MGELGGVGAFNGFMGRLVNAVDLKRDKGMGGAISESKSLIRGNRTGIDSAGN